jgi:hypothetical protein
VVIGMMMTSFKAVMFPSFSGVIAMSVLGPSEAVAVRFIEMTRR